MAEESRSADSVKSYQSVRSISAKVLTGVLNGASLTRLLTENAGLVAPNERPLLSEMTYGSCRWFHRLDAVLKQLLQKPLRRRDTVIRSLLIIGLYQLTTMRIKPHAVVAETVNAARHLGKPMFTKLVNGVLRRFQREHETLLQKADVQIPSRFSMPDWLLQKIKKDWPDDWQQICLAMLEAPPMSLRLNTAITNCQSYLDQLSAQGIHARAIDGLPTAVILDQSMAVESIPGFIQGQVSVQDAGAQLAARLLDAQEDDRVLDACAAPGGKTGHLLEHTENLDLTAIDIDELRLERVSENLQRLNQQAKLLVGNAAEPDGAWSQLQYDAILLDVPCSATGVIRRHPDIKLLRREEDIQNLAREQRKILQACWSLLKPGGKLLYVTCSLLSDENEKEIAWFLAQQDDANELSLQPGVPHKTRQHGIQVIPGDSTMDGFYYALLTKG